MKRGRKPRDEKQLKKAVAEACEAVIAKGKRPTIRNVWSWLAARDGSAASFTDLAPLVRDWKSARRDTRAVEAVCKAYGELDAEQRKAVRDILGLLPKP